MNKQHTAIGALLGGLLVLTLGARSAPTPQEKPLVVVGTFDSRAVLFAYVGSDAFKQELQSLRAELERAKAAGNDKRAAELEAQGPAMQERIHSQGFGSAPVDDILARIVDSLPRIAAEAGVDVIVSKWVLTYQDPGARFVDVSEALAVEFDPSEETWKGIREIMAKEPIPLEQLSEH